MGRPGGLKEEGQGAWRRESIEPGVIVLVLSPTVCVCVHACEHDGVCVCVCASRYVSVRLAVCVCVPDGMYQGCVCSV